MKSFILALVIFISFSFGGIKNISLEKALEMLKDNNSQLKIAKLENLIKEYDISLAGAKNFGKMDIAMDAIESNSPLNAFAFKLQNKNIAQSDFDPAKLNNPKSGTHYKINLSYSLPLYTGGRIAEYKSIANSLYNISKLEKRDILNKKIIETKKVFYNISLIEKYIQSLSIILNNIEKLKKSINSMSKEGYTTNTDMLEVKARLSRVSSMYEQGLSHRKISYEFLSFLLNQEIDSIVNVENISKNNDVKKYNINNTIDVKKALSALKIQESMQNIEFANFMPTVGLFANYDMENEETSNFETSYSVGIRVGANIFNGGSDMIKYQQFKIKTIQSKEKIKLARKALSLKVNKLKSQISASQNNVKSLEDRLKLLKEIYKIYISKYQEGLVSINDVLVKQSKEIEVLLQLLRARSIYNASILELKYIKNEGQ